MLYLLTVKVFLYSVALTVISGLGVWKVTESRPSFTVGYGYAVSSTDK